jgi:hypothetical protein
MSHFLLTVVGDHIDEQLAIYDINLPVQPYRRYLTANEHYAGAQPDGRDEHGHYIISHANNRGKWDWNIMGGRWCGYLKLKHGAYGEIGKRGAGIADEDPLTYGDLSADQALYGDIDWYGMRMYNRSVAAEIWDNCPPGEGWRFGIEASMDRDEFLKQRSHPATFAILKDSEWYERGNKGWWGPMLDAGPVSDWHRRWDGLMSTCTPDTLITIIDCHIASQT